MKLSEAFKEISDLRMDCETVPEVVPEKPKPKEKIKKEAEPVKEKEEKKPVSVHGNMSCCC